jgi:hypothetical protein
VKPIDPQAAMETMWKIAPEFAKAKGERVYLDEARKSLKAVLMKKCGVEAIGAQEREAYAHEDYQAYLHGLSAAVEREESLKWRLIAAQAAIDIWRTQQANNRNIDKAAA